MPRKRYKPEENVAKLRQVDVLVSQEKSPVRTENLIGDDYGFGQIKFPVLAPEFPAPLK